MASTHKRYIPDIFLTSFPPFYMLLAILESFPPCSMSREPSLQEQDTAGAQCTIVRQCAHAQPQYVTLSVEEGFSRGSKICRSKAASNAQIAISSARLAGIDVVYSSITRAEAPQHMQYLHVHPLAPCVLTFVTMQSRHSVASASMRLGYKLCGFARLGSREHVHTCHN